MKNKELLLRRMESIENRLKVLRNALNERDLEKAKLILQEVLELREDAQSIVEKRKLIKNKSYEPNPRTNSE
jgi:hypothetical protein